MKFLSFIMLCSICILSCQESLIMIILAIIAITILGSLMMIFTYNIIWLSFIINMLMVGGLMVVYIFIISMQPNDIIKLNINKLMIMYSMIISMMAFFLKANSSKTTLAINIYESSPTIIMLCMIFIVWTMYFSSVIIMCPSKASKSVK